MTTNQQKLTIMRKAGKNPAEALLAILAALEEQNNALIGAKLAEIEAKLPERVILAHVEKLKGEKGDEADPVDYNRIVAAAVPMVLEKVKIPKPKDGDTPTDERLLEIIRPLIPKVKDGDPPSEVYLLSLIRKIMPDIASMRPTDDELRAIVAGMVPEAPEVDMEEVDDRIEKAVKGIVIDASQIKNLPKQKKEKGGKYMHGGGPTYLQPKSTEVPNGSLAVFTAVGASQKPSFVYADYAKKPAVSKSGAILWTWSAATGQVTMTTPPNEDLYFEQ